MAVDITGASNPPKGEPLEWDTQERTCTDFAVDLHRLAGVEGLHVEVRKGTTPTPHLRTAYTTMLCVTISMELPTLPRGKERTRPHKFIVPWNEATQHRQRALDDLAAYAMLIFK